MPKSRFNAVREKARASRHNPLQRHTNVSSNGQDAEADASFSVDAGQKGDVLPVLKSLPLPDSPDAGGCSASHEDVLWALTSLTGFLSTKALRNELLTPKHEIVARILFQLQGDRPIEIRDAASGCLRNLCIEAAGKARKALEARGCVATCIEEMQLVARTLGLIEGEGPVEKQSELGKRDMSFLNKPKEEMNRKERRLAAKAEAAAAKRQAQFLPNGKPSPNGKALPTEQVTNAGEAAHATNGSDDEKTAIRCSHLSNLASVVWCLVEMSPLAVESCERAAPVLGRIFAQATRQGAKALRSLQAEANNAAAPQSSGKIDVGRKEQQQIEQAWVDVANACLNALVTLSDTNARICAGIVGISRQELMLVTRGKAKVSVVLDEGTEDDLTRVEGKENVASLCDAVLLLEQAMQEGVPSTPMTRQTSSLGLLALATIRNIQTSLPTQLRESVKLTRDDAGPVTLTLFEAGYGLRCLQKTLSRGASTSIETLVSELSTSDSTSSTQSNTNRQAQEEINNLNLALEVLAELVGDREKWSSDSRSSDQADTGVDVEDEEMDVEDGDDTEVAEVDDEAMALEESEDSDGQLSTEFRQTRIAIALTPSLLEPLMQLAFDLAESSCAFTVGASDASASALRGIVIRALSVLSNAVLVLASYAQPPPSQPMEDKAQRQKVASFQDWLIQPQQKDLLARLWRWSFEMASRAAASPIVAQDEQTADADQRAAATEGKRIVESCLGIMWSLSRCFEGLETEASQILITESSQFANDTKCTLARQGNGVIESMLAAYKGSKRVSSTLPSNETSINSTLSAADPTTWASADGIRVHCLGVLSTLARQPHVWQTYLPAIATLLARVLEALPRSSHPNDPSGAQGDATLAALELRDWTSIDGMVVAVNGMIDTFADETQPWDGQYAALKLQGKLKRASADIRSAARSIDKRKQASLRVAADEAWDNLMGFLTYRDSLKV